MPRKLDFLDAVAIEFAASDAERKQIRGKRGKKGRGRSSKVRSPSKSARSSRTISHANNSTRFQHEPSGHDSARQGEDVEDTCLDQETAYSYQGTAQTGIGPSASLRRPQPSYQSCTPKSRQSRHNPEHASKPRRTRKESRNVTGLRGLFKRLFSKTSDTNSNVADLQAGSRKSDQYAIPGGYVSQATRTSTRSHSGRAEESRVTGWPMGTARPRSPENAPHRIPDVYHMNDGVLKDTYQPEGYSDDGVTSGTVMPDESISVAHHPRNRRRRTRAPSGRS